MIFFLAFMLVLVALLAFAALYLLSWALPSLFFRGAPFVPTSEETVQKMIKLAEIKNTDRVCDLGCGDGRILLAALKAGAKKGIGYEIDPRLITRTKKKLTQEGFFEKLELHWKSMWDADLRDVDVVFLYQITYAMRGLEEKLLQELHPGARVISSGFVFPNWQPIKTAENIRVYIV